MNADKLFVFNPRSSAAEFLMNKIIHGETVVGVDVDAQTRCFHWHGERDVIAIKFKCCERWFPCYECHAELEKHSPQVWAHGEFDANAILCGVCGHQSTINEYLNCDSTCPQCSSAFNPGCVKHYHLYFESLSRICGERT